MAETWEDKWERMFRDRPGYSGPRVQYRGNMDINRPAMVRRIARGTPGIPSRITRKFNTQPGGGGGRRSGGATQGAFEDVWSNVSERLMDQYQETAAQQQAINNANEAEAERDYPWYQDAFHTLTGVGPGSFDESIIGRGLNIASRPAFGIFEAFNAIAGKEEEDYPNGESMGWDAFVDDLGDIGSGFWQGFSGQERTGFGQVYESLKNNESMGAGFLQDFEEAHPALEQTVAQGVGLAGELFLDPLNVLIPAAPRVMRETGELATEATLRETLLNAVREQTDEFATNSGLIQNVPMYANDPDLLIRRLEAAMGDNFNNAVVTVAGGGNRATSIMNDTTFPSTVANQTVEEIRTAMTEGLRTSVDDMWSYGSSGRITVGMIASARRASPDFDEFITRLLASMPPGSTADDIVDGLAFRTIPKGLVDNAYREVVAKYESALDPHYAEIFKAVENPTYRSLGLRIGATRTGPGKTFALRGRSRRVPGTTIRPVGRAYAWAGSKLDDVFPNRGNRFGLAFEHEVPGIFALKLGRARALGFNAMDDFRKELEAMARKFTREEGIEFGRHLENGLPLVGKSVRSGEDKAAMLARLRQMLDDIFAEEMALGARPVTGRGSRKVDNYFPVYNKSGTKANRTLFKERRKIDAHKPGVIGVGEWKLAKAQQMGLKPIEDAFDAIYHRRLKMARDSVRATFLQDLVTNYAVHGTNPVGRLSDKALTSRGLTRVSENMLQHSYRVARKAKGGEFYIPTPIWELYKTVDEMLSWSTADWNGIGRAFANVIGKLKKGLTIPYPGFHMKNFIGDVFMGLLDGVNPKHYANVLRQRARKLAGGTGNYDIVPGLSFTHDGFVAQYMQNADAGFVRTEFGTFESLTAGAIPRRMGRAVSNAATQLADKREMYPRLVHFITAYTDEAQALWRAGHRDIDEIMRRASDAAISRVNAYKFDYSALLPWEKTIKTLAFPFYTYLRKAIPLLLQQMFQNPRFFAAVNRFMEYNDGSAADNFNADNIPQYIRDIGFGMLTDEEEPWAITADILPFGALDILGSSDVGELSQNVLSNLNPLFQAPIELATGNELFSGRSIEDESGLQYLMDNIPLLGDIEEELGIPNPLTDTPTGDPVWEQLTSTDVFHNRLAGLGIPARQITAGQQLQQQNTNFDNLIEDPIGDFNHSQDRYRITITSEFMYRITDQTTGVVLGTVATPQAAIDMANRLPGVSYNQEFVSPYQQPTSMDVQGIIEQMQMAP